MSGAVWIMIRKCLEVGAVPFLVSRKMAYINRSMFARLGILGFEMYRQVFAPRVSQLLVDIQHTDRLGYKDVVAVSADPYPPLVRFLSEVLPVQIPAYRRRWEEQNTLLTEFAVRRGLGSREMSDADRNAHQRDFFRAVLTDADPDEY